MDVFITHTNCSQPNMLTDTHALAFISVSGCQCTSGPTIPDPFFGVVYFCATCPQWQRWSAQAASPWTSPPHRAGNGLESVAPRLGNEQ